MGRYDILLEQEDNRKEPQTPATGQPHPGAPQQATPPPTSTESPTHAPSTPSRQSLGRTPDRPNGRPPTRTPERSPQRRIITRNSFEIYEDQMESLRKLAYREKMIGGVGSMSRMVRHAIDHYLTTNTPSNDEPERTND